nr:xylulose kinase-1 [Tanacetum cinerariifolium]
MPPRMTTRSAGRPAAASLGVGTGRRAGRGGGRTKGHSGDQGDGRIDGQGGQVGSQGSEVNDAVNGVPDFSTIVVQQLRILLPTIVVQVGDQGRGQGNARNQNDDAINDNTRGDVRNVIENNDLGREVAVGDDENATNLPPVPPTPQAPHTLSTIKLPILKKERETKAMTTLLMAILEDHLAKFHKIIDAKEMWEAIKSRFGGNDEFKKMRKYIVKQQFEGFSISNSDGLYNGYDSSIKYALMVNPNIYVSYIKQFWTTVAVKKVNDVIRLQAVDKKKVVCMSAKRTSWNEFSSSMAFVVICLSSGDDAVHGEDVNAGDAAEGDVSAANDEVPTINEDPSIPSPTPPTPPPQPSHDIPSTSQVQPTPPQSPQVQPPSPQPQPQPQPDAAIPMNLLQERVKKLERRNKVKVLKLRRLQKVGTTQKDETSDKIVMDDVSNQERMIAEMDQDADVVLEEAKEVVEDAKVDESVDIQGRQAESQAEIYKIDLEQANKVLSMQEDESEPTEVQEVVEVVTTTKIITEVVTAASETITAASTTITAAEAQVPAATLTAAPARHTAAPRIRTKGVVIRDPQEESTISTIIPAETKSKDKGKGILVKELKPLKKQQQIKQDEKYARELEADLNKSIDWDEAIDHVIKKAKEDNVVKRYQAMKRKPRTEAQARKNMMVYLKNVVGFKIDYFKGMSYDDIRPIFERYFDSNMPFLQKTNEQIKEKESKTLKRINETPTEKATKRKKLDEEVEELKRHLQIVPNEDDDVYTEATPLARKVPVVDYEVINMNNKPYYKIIRADDTHQLYVSFLSLLRNFNREDLEALWSLVKEIFSTTKPKNFSNDFLLITLGTMFEKPDIHAQI